MTFENEIDTLRDTISIVSSKTYENGVWVENFDDGLPENGIVHYNNDGGGMTFSIANDEPLLGESYFKMGGRVNWDWSLGNIDIPWKLIMLVCHQKIYILTWYTFRSSRLTYGTIY